MPTDTLDILDHLHRTIHDLAGAPESGADRAARLLHAAGLGLDSLVELLAAASKRRAPDAASGTPGSLTFYPWHVAVGSEMPMCLSGEKWIPMAPGTYRGFLTAFSTHLGAVVLADNDQTDTPRWRAYIGGHALRWADGTVADFVAPEAAFDAVAGVMRRMRLVAGLPAIAVA